MMLFRKFLIIYIFSLKNAKMKILFQSVFKKRYLRDFQTEQVKQLTRY
jgi:hypothetical protein